MKSAYPLLAGPLAAVIFWVGIIVMPLLIPGYGQVHQTVSEIGMLGSPMRVPFAVTLGVVSLFLLVFGWALARLSGREGHSALAAYLTACMAISATGAGIYAYPLAPHNYFGLSELVAYQAPLALAVTWRRDPRAAAVVRLSWLMAVLMWAAIVVNLSVLDRGGSLWAYERPFYGLMQRSLFAVFFVWCAAVGVLFYLKHSRKSASHPSPIPT